MFLESVTSIYSEACLLVGYNLEGGPLAKSILTTAENYQPS